MRFEQTRYSICTVSPAKVTLEPDLSDERSIVLEAGAEIPDRTMFEHDLTGEEIEALAVPVQAALVPPLLPVAVGTDIIDTTTLAVVLVAVVVVVFSVVAYKSKE